LFLIFSFLLSLKSTVHLSLVITRNSHSVSAVKAITVHYPCKCCRMITIEGRVKYRIILPCISLNCTLRNCLSLQNGLISHEAPLLVCAGVSGRRMSWGQQPQRNNTLTSAPSRSCRNPLSTALYSIPLYRVVRVKQTL
jgi:hypothetical protein